MTGEITPATIIKSNTFIIWRGGTPADFELKVDYRITSGGNSGINYRSVVVPDKVTPENKFAMRGYQCDIDGQNRYTGNNYEEKGRLFLAVRGQVTRITGVRKPIILSSLGDEKELSAIVKNDWNAVHLIARGNVLMHHVNGRLMCMVIDDDVANRTAKGLIGVQVHVGGPMKVEYETGGSRKCRRQHVGKMRAMYYRLALFALIVSCTVAAQDIVETFGRLSRGMTSQRERISSQSRKPPMASPPR